MSCVQVESNITLSGKLTAGQTGEWREERGVEGWGNLTDIDITLFVSIATISSINRNIYCTGLYEDQCPSLSQQSYECQAPFWLSEELKEVQSVDQRFL